jgi:cytochrome b561
VKEERLPTVENPRERLFSQASPRISHPSLAGFCMMIVNSRLGYGALTKLFHRLIVLLFTFEYFSAPIMLRTPAEATTLGLGQATYHKSLGLFALIIAIARLVNRRTSELPPWAPTLTALEADDYPSAEQLLYAAMLIMPLSGFIYVMAGGLRSLALRPLRASQSYTLIHGDHCVCQVGTRGRCITTSLTIRNPSRPCFGPSLWAEGPTNRPHFAWKVVLYKRPSSDRRGCEGAKD